MSRAVPTMQGVSDVGAITREAYWRRRAIEDGECPDCAVAGLRLGPPCRTHAEVVPTPTP